MRKFWAESGGRGTSPPANICRAVGSWGSGPVNLGLRPRLVYVGPLALIWLGGRSYWGLDQMLSKNR